MALSFAESKEKLTSLENPMQMFNEKASSVFIQSDKYKIYENYSDDKFSNINEKKEIHIEPSQQVLTQEVNSQYIPFEMSRYYDGIDLMSMSLVIHYINSKNRENHSIPVNVSYSDEKIRFHWLIDENVTCIAGEIAFEIIAYGTNEKEETYIWKSMPNGKLVVLKSLSGNGVISNSDPLYIKLIEELKKQVEEASISANNAASHANTAKDYASKIEMQMDTIKNEVLQEVNVEIDNTIVNKLDNYCTKPELNETINSVLNPENIDGNFS